MNKIEKKVLDKEINVICRDLKENVKDNAYFAYSFGYSACLDQLQKWIENNQQISECDKTLVLLYIKTLSSSNAGELQMLTMRME